jgi:hypothetical protein
MIITAKNTTAAVPDPQETTDPANLGLDLDDPTTTITTTTTAPIDTTQIRRMKGSRNCGQNARNVRLQNVRKRRSYCAERRRKTRQAGNQFREVVIRSNLESIECEGRTALTV